MKIWAMWGAMYPVQELTVAEISNGKVTALDSDGGEIFLEVEHIRNERPASGSPIGVYWNRKDAY